MAALKGHIMMHYGSLGYLGLLTRVTKSLEKQTEGSFDKSPEKQEIWSDCDRL